MNDRRFLTTGWVAAALALALAGCGHQGNEHAAERPDAPTDDEVAQARSVYENMGCGACHGDSGEGIAGTAPALEKLAPYWTVEKLEAYLRDPQAFRAEHPDFDARHETRYDAEMPAFDFLSDEDLRALADWLLKR